MQNLVIGALAFFGSFNLNVIFRDHEILALVINARLGVNSTIHSQPPSQTHALILLHHSPTPLPSP